jgi:hypothetical protein
MNIEEIKTAVDAGKKVQWSNPGYLVIKDNKGQYLIQHTNGSCIGLTNQDGTVLNGDEQEFSIVPQNGYKAFYFGRETEVYADTSYEAQTIAAKHFKAKKTNDVTVILCEKPDGEQVVHTADF